MIAPFVKGITGVGVGAIGARILSNLVKNQLFADPLKPADPMVKIAIEAGVGIVGGLVIGKFLKQRALGAGIAAGAAVIVALDIYDLYIAPSLPAMLKDYQYGSLSDWAPQGGGGIAAYEQGQLSGAGVYDGGVYS